MKAGAIAFLVVALAGAARAQGPPAPAGEPDDDPEADGLPSPDDAITDRVSDLETQLAQARGVAEGRKPRVTLSGYVDFGAFAVQGNGAGYVQDYGNAAFPEYAGRYAWVFLGDILATAVNARGEPADLGDAPGADRYDTVHSRGAPGFIVNEANLTLTSAITDGILATASADFMPRTGSEFRMGDVFEIDLAQIEWMPTVSHRTSIFVGKFDSVLGIEYRERKAVQRFGIAPTMLARYTTGTPLGLKLRSKIGDGDRLVVAAAVTNGSSTTEAFHFYDEIDSNAGKTGSARIAARLPIPGGDVEVGVSGAYGAQDRALDSASAMWFAGVDLIAHAGPIDLKGQYLRGGADGRPQDRVYGLKLRRAAYLEADVRVSPVIGLLARGELRDALVWLADERAYLTKSWRAVGGLRLDFTERLVGKVEVLHNGEYGGIPAIRNDVVTSSLLIVY